MKHNLNIDDDDDVASSIAPVSPSCLVLLGLTLQCLTNSTCLCNVSNLHYFPLLYGTPYLER